MTLVLSNYFIDVKKKKTEKEKVANLTLPLVIVCPQAFYTLHQHMGYTKFVTPFETPQNISQSVHILHRH